MRTRARWLIALAISTVCCSAMLSWPTLDVGVDVELELLEGADGFPPHAAPVNPGSAEARSAIGRADTFSATERRSDDAEFLVDGGDAATGGVVRCSELDLVPVHEDSTSVRMLGAADEFGQAWTCRHRSCRRAPELRQARPRTSRVLSAVTPGYRLLTDSATIASGGWGPSVGSSARIAGTSPIATARPRLRSSAGSGKAVGVRLLPCLHVIGIGRKVHLRRRDREVLVDRLAVDGLEGLLNGQDPICCGV